MAPGNATDKRLRIAMLFVLLLAIAGYSGTYAQDATPSANGSPVEVVPETPVNVPYLWQADLEQRDIFYPPTQVAAWEDRVYVLEPNGGLQVYDAESGILLSDQVVGSSPLTLADYLYVDDQFIVVGEAKRTIALDRLTGIELWEVAATSNGGSGILSLPSVWNGVVYMSDADGPQTSPASDIFGVALETGDELWRTSVGWMDAYPLVAFDGLVFATEEDGDVSALDAASGVVRWSTNFPRRALATFSLAPGIVGFEYQVPSAPSFRTAIAAIDASTGAPSWGVLEPAKYLTSDGATIYVDAGDPQAGTSDIQAIDGATGTVLWSLPTAPVFAMEAHSGSLFATTKSDDSTLSGSNAELLKIDAATGTITSDAPLVQGGRSLAFAGESIVVQTFSSLLIVDSATLLPKYELVGSNGSSVAIDDAGRVFTVDPRNTLNALDPDWFEPHTAAGSAPIVPAETVLDGGYMELPDLPSVFLGLWESVIQPGGTFQVPPILGETSAFLLSGTITITDADGDSVVATGPSTAGLTVLPVTMENTGKEPAVVLIVVATAPAALPEDEQTSAYRFTLLSNMTFKEPPGPWVSVKSVAFDLLPGAATAPTASIYPGWIYLEQGRLQHVESTSALPTPPGSLIFYERPELAGSAVAVAEGRLVQLVNESADAAQAWNVELLFGPQPGAGGCAGRCRS